MSVETKTWRVGIVGIGPVGLFLIERLGLEPTIRLIGAYEYSPERRALATGFKCQIWDQPQNAVVCEECDVLFFTDHYSKHELSSALEHGKHVVVDQPWRLSSSCLFEIHETAIRFRKSAVPLNLRRYSSDFSTAVKVQKTGRIGPIHSANLVVYEKGLPANPESAGALREFGFDWLDQLLLVVDSSPSSVFAKQIVEENRDHSFLAIIDFANGCTAQIEFRSRSLLSFRTGWMLEGSTGSFRDKRLFTLTTDGEIVDEPIAQSEIPSDQLIHDLASVWQGESRLIASLKQAASVVQLMESIERSASSGVVVKM